MPTTATAYRVGSDAMMSIVGVFAAVVIFTFLTYDTGMVSHLSLADVTDFSRSDHREHLILPEVVPLIEQAMRDEEGGPGAPTLHHASDDAHRPLVGTASHPTGQAEAVPHQEAAPSESVPHTTEHPEGSAHAGAQMDHSSAATSPPPHQLPTEAQESDLMHKQKAAAAPRGGRVIDGIAPFAGDLGFSLADLSSHPARDDAFVSSIMPMPYSFPRSGVGQYALRNICVDAEGLLYFFGKPPTGDSVSTNLSDTAHIFDPAGVLRQGLGHKRELWITTEYKLQGPIKYSYYEDGRPQHRVPIGSPAGTPPVPISKRVAYIYGIILSTWIHNPWHALLNTLGGWVMLRDLGLLPQYAEPFPTDSPTVAQFIPKTVVSEKDAVSSKPLSTKDGNGGQKGKGKGGKEAESLEERDFHQIMDEAGGGPHTEGDARFNYSLYGGGDGRRCRMAAGEERCPVVVHAVPQIARYNKAHPTSFLMWDFFRALTPSVGSGRKPQLPGDVIMAGKHLTAWNQSLMCHREAYIGYPLLCNAYREHPDPCGYATVTNEDFVQFTRVMLRLFRVPEYRPPPKAFGSNGLRLVYVKRGGNRVLFNSKELIRTAEAMGFQIAHVEMHTLSLAQQMAAARSADVFLSPHGAAMTWSAFMRPGAALIELGVWLWLPGFLSGKNVMQNATYGGFVARVGVDHYIDNSDLIPIKESAFKDPRALFEEKKRHRLSRWYGGFKANVTFFEWALQDILKSRRGEQTARVSVQGPVEVHKPDDGK